MLSADGELTDTTIYSFPRSCTGFPARIVPDRHFTADVQISFAPFYEIEKASNTLWNLLLGILGQITLTLGDNRKIDFSRAMIFMTSNLGAAEMRAMLSPKIGFAVQTSTPAQNDGLDLRSAEARMPRTQVYAGIYQPPRQHSYFPTTRHKPASLDR